MGNRAVVVPNNPFVGLECLLTLVRERAATIVLIGVPTKGLIGDIVAGMFWDAFVQHVDFMRKL